MSISTVATPQMTRVQDLADQAMTTSDGITVLFRVEKYGNLKACKTAARGMQVSFCNLRVRSRRIAQRLKGETISSLAGTTKGEYDNIACVVRPLDKEGGYSVALIPSYAFDMDLEVIDNSTGKPFAGEDPKQNKFISLMGKWFKEDAEARKQKRGMLNPFNTDELRFMWEFDGAMCEEMHVPSMTSNAVHDATDYASVDLAMLSEEELEIVNPGDEE